MIDLQIPPITADLLRSLALQSGADDAGVVAVGRAELDSQREDLLSFYPWAKTLLSFVCKMNREPIRGLPRSVANNEFHHTGHEVDEVTRSVVRELESMGVRASSPAMGFPMEMERFPGKLWTVSHKPVAVAAGLGQIGIHRNLIHSKFGNFVPLGTVVIDAVVEEQSETLDYNPCIECKLCVSACPVGAIGPDGHFDFSACYTHNYREFMGGFTDFVETVAESRDRNDYRSKMRDSETTSVWQSLSFGAN
jgi:epoxyqueuosine reductase QueG